MNIKSPPLTLEHLERQVDKVKQMMTYVRSAVLAPSEVKKPPLFTIDQIATLAGVAVHAFRYALTNRPDMPTGNVAEGGRKRFFTLAETRTWVKELRVVNKRPAGAEAVTIAIANFKGGTTKTTTAMVLGQGLSLLGHKVLIIDADAQASLTTIFGFLPEFDISLADTLLPLLRGTQTSVRPMIRNTYWDGLDLIPAATNLFAAEFEIPARQINEENFEFWTLLDYGLQDVRDEYDVIIIDTPPAMSYVTIIALMAANGIIMPLPPQTLDYASAGQFWTQFTEMATQLRDHSGVEKAYDFINVLLSRVSKTQSTDQVRELILATYSDKVLPLEIPKTEAADISSMELGTVYDQTLNLKDRTFKRARDAYDQLILHVDGSIKKAWDRQLPEAPPSNKSNGSAQLIGVTDGS